MVFKKIRQSYKQATKRQVFPSINYLPSNEQYVYRLAVKDNIRQVTNYYKSLVDKELQRFVKSTEYMRQKIFNYFTQHGGDYSYQCIDLMGLGYNFSTYQKLTQQNYYFISKAIASSITRELNNGNYGYALNPIYPYFYSDRSGAYLFPSAPIINCLYSQQVQRNIRGLFRKYFSQTPNFGAAFDCAIHQYPTFIGSNGKINFSIPETSPAYPIYIASNYNYNLPDKFLDRMLSYIQSSNSWNHVSNQGSKNYLVNKYEKKGQLPAGYYTPKQILYLVRPFMYSYFQPDIPIYQSFTNYFNLHKGKWPSFDVRQVLTHFMSMDQRVGYDENDNPILESVQDGKPLLGVRTQKEEDDYYNQQLFIDGDPFDDNNPDNVYQPIDYIPDPNTMFKNDYINAIQSGNQGLQIPQVSRYNNKDIRRVPNGDDNF